MRTLKKTDFLRRIITKKISKLLLFFFSEKPPCSIEKKNIKKVLIVRPNHRLGNQLLITPLVQEITNTFPDVKIDLFLKGNLGKIIFENFSSVNTIIMLPKNHFKELRKYVSGWVNVRSKKYDLVINADTNSSSGKISALISKSNLKMIEEQPPIHDLPADATHLAKTSVYQLRAFLQKLGLEKNSAEISPLDLNLKPNEIENGKRILSQITKYNKPVIGIYTYATSDKCYTPEQWMPFYNALKEKYEKQYTIIEILPIENISQIHFSAIHFYSKDIRELASVIHNLALFISADCGMMHLASASKTTVIGLFKRTNMEKYQPYSHFSIGLHTMELNSSFLFKEIAKRI